MARVLLVPALRGFFLAALLAPAASKAGQKSAVFILIDDLGHNDIGYNNRTADGKVAGRHISSPHIDALADGGLKLTNYYVHPVQTCSCEASPGPLASRCLPRASAACWLPGWLAAGNCVRPRQPVRAGRLVPAPPAD
eukprot:SAG22_NODE_380_length_11402_cov_8.514154_3_plen_138_part_00